jgi:hypothetical protein
MRTPLLFLCSALVLSFTTSPLFADIIIVDKTSIQKAIDGAHDGDVILVKGYPEGTFSYAKFTIDAKGVAVRSFSMPFVIQEPTITVQNIPSGKRASVSGMSLRGGGVLVNACAGEVLLEDIQMPTLVPDDYWGNGGQPRVELSIHSCENVSVNGLTIGGEYTNAGADPAVEIVDSRVRMTDVAIKGEYPSPPVSGGDGADGGHAISVSDSLLVVARPHIVGGQGGAGTFDKSGGPDGVGGRGGDGIHATSSAVIVLGADSDAITGGQGGKGAIDIFYQYTSKGGQGGDGWHGQSLQISKVALVAGAGGPGAPDGDPGLPSVGTVLRADVMPYLGLTPNLVPGGSGTLTLHSINAGTFVALVATQGGFLNPGGIFGPPISAVPGGVFIVLPIGHVGPDSDLNLPFNVPNDPALRGVALDVQSILLADAGGVYTTQAVARVISQ